MEGRTGTGSSGAREHLGGASRSARSSRRRTILYIGVAIALVVMSLALAGCGGDLPGPAASAAVLAGVGPANTVTVSGQATVTSPPDEAVIVLTVENDAATAPDAMNATSVQSQQMLDRLKSDGIPDSAIQTSNITLYPVRTYDPTTGKETLTGYRAQNSVKVTLKDAPTVAKVLAAGVETGATLVSGPDWRLKDDSQAVNDALKQAVTNARAKAETLAAAAGGTLGEVLVMSEGTVQVPVSPIFSAAGAADSSKVVQPPVSSGTLDVTATVAVTYALKH
jgi:uncharacterized protein YggE